MGSKGQPCSLSFAREKFVAQCWQMVGSCPMPSSAARQRIGLSGSEVRHVGQRPPFAVAL
eukprot:scaffold14658_cov67-Phaeocystis_antarctica.AAC.3